MLARSTQREIVGDLRQHLLTWEGAPHPAFSGGLDALFPQGFRRGTLIEYLADGGSGAVALSLAAAREACREGQALVVIDRARTFYPPAAVPFGVDANTILVRPRTRKDELWALHQSLSCPGVGAVLCWPDRLDGRAFRALQLAAERGGAVGFLIRTPNVRGDPSWSETQLSVQALPGKGVRRLKVEVLRSRSGNEGASAVMELDDEAGTLQPSRAVPVASELAVAAAAARSPRA